MQRLERLLCDFMRLHLNGQPGRPPEGGAVLLGHFGSLSIARSWHANGPNPISFPEIEAWARLMQVPLKPAHVSILRAMDAVWIEHFHQKRDKAPEGVATLPPMSQHPINAALLDAMMG